MRWYAVKWVVVGLLVVGSVWTAAHRDPWDPDETRYLQVARETLHSGNPLLPRYNGEPYADKPAPYFWLLGATGLLLGADSALAGVIPSLLGLIGLALAIPRLGKAAGLRRETAELGTVMTLSCLLPAGLGFLCRMDLLFALTCTLALERLVRLGSSDATRRDHLLLWVWIGVGLLIKGPLALALPLLAAVALAVVDRRPLLGMLRGWEPLLAVAMVCAWLLPAALSGGREWLGSVVLGQTTLRLASGTVHQEAWWYHLATLPLSMLPWSVVAVPAVGSVLFGWRRQPRPLLLVGLFTLTTLVLLTLVPSKTLLYPLPLFPPACMLAARMLTSAPSGSRRWPVPTAACTVLLGVLLWLAPDHLPDLQLSIAGRALLAGSLVVPGCLALLAAAVGRSRDSMLCCALAVPLLLAAGLQPVYPTVNRLLSLRPFADAYAEHAGQASPPPAAYEKIQPGFLLFTGARFELLSSPAQLRQSLDAGRLVAINGKAARRLRDTTDLRWAVATEIPYRHTTILLIRAVESSDAIDDLGPR